jgi:aminobenzoyl-glutamate utilization protein B
MTVLDVLLRPDVVTAARDYFTNVQTKSRKYVPLLRESDRPAIELNTAIMQKYKPALQKFYYDPARYKTYLEQLGITYPTVRPAPQKPTAQ